MKNVASTDRHVAKKRTPKQRVLRKFHNAYAHKGPDDLWAVFGSRFGGPYRYLSTPQRTAGLAWRSAALRHV